MIISLDLFKNILTEGYDIGCHKAKLEIEAISKAISILSKHHFQVRNGVIFFPPQLFVSLSIFDKERLLRFSVITPNAYPQPLEQSKLDVIPEEIEE